MPDASTYGLFIAASLALTLVPGPAVLYIVARSVEGGRWAGLVSVLGVGVGGLVHVFFAAAGLSAVLASSATAFSVVKWLGVAYLVYLGLQRILAGEEGDAEITVEREPLSRVFSQGMIVNILNPKTALFFLAFLPQFVDPSRGAATAQIALLGITFVVLALCTDGLYALLSGTAADWLRRRNENPWFRRGQRYVSGAVYLALGAAAAATGSGKD
ncbi:MAG: Putative threonine efflux protein [uncultured Rubrobacteraceae bacterium]|uniref:Threonine efflux protein n=1 Tax=uncultured Rubrobacteraceae bacterium TaxID=349277 RepID=A0A6J4SF54_9ACTN|nr:MAG: Putative threonine efflux protein [uncultured Rubrobacteraceae bacterium]